MELDLLAGSWPAVDFAPQTEALEIIQNCQTILSTTKFSVPLDRDFGLDASFVDEPLLAAKVKIESEIFTALKKYEPRVTIKQITWTADPEGIIKPKVKVVINET